MVTNVFPDMFHDSFGNYYVCKLKSHSFMSI